MSSREILIFNAAPQNPVTRSMPAAAAGNAPGGLTTTPLNDTKTSAKAPSYHTQLAVTPPEIIQSRVQSLTSAVAQMIITKSTPPALQPDAVESGNMPRVYVEHGELLTAPGKKTVLPAKRVDTQAYPSNHGSSTSLPQRDNTVAQTGCDGHRMSQGAQALDLFSALHTNFGSGALIIPLADERIEHWSRFPLNETNTLQKATDRAITVSQVEETHDHFRRWNWGEKLIVHGAACPHCAAYLNRIDDNDTSCRPACLGCEKRLAALEQVGFDKAMAQNARELAQARETVRSVRKDANKRITAAMSERDNALQFRVEAVEARALSEQLRTHVKSLEAVCNFLAKQPEALRNELESLKVQQELDKFRNTQLPGQVVDQDESLDGRDRKRRRTTVSTAQRTWWPRRLTTGGH